MPSVSSLVLPRLPIALVCVALGACGGDEPGDDGGAGSAGAGRGSQQAGSSGSGAGGAGSGGSAGGGAAGKSGSGGAGTSFGGGTPGGSAGTPVTGGSGAVGGSAGAASGAAGMSEGGAQSGGVAGQAGGAAGASSGGAGGQGGAGAGSGGAGGLAGAGGSGASANITVWLAGDSTMANGNACPIGWGQEFDAYFDERVRVVNSAVGGRSVRTWLYHVGTTKDAEGECVLERDGGGNPTLQDRWQAMLDGMQAGHYLFIQFGINDGSADCDRHVGLEAFKESYGVMAEAAKMRGTQPIFVTPVSSIACNGSMARGTRGSFVTATLEAGEEYDVPVIDLHELSVALYDELAFCPIPGGADVSASTGGEVGAFFCDDHTHFDEPGAIRIAGLVASALGDRGLGLAAYLK